MALLKVTDRKMDLGVLVMDRLPNEVSTPFVLPLELLFGLFGLVRLVGLLGLLGS